MIKQHLSQSLLQKLSPQQIQLMKLLQIPTSVLDQRIQEELESNPALDEGNEQEETYDQDEKDTEYETDYEAEASEHSDKDSQDDLMNSDSFDDYLNNYMDDNTASYKYKSDEFGGSEEEHRPIPIAVESTFHDHLKKQIGLLKLKNDNQYKIALQLIGSIDDDGYLRREPNAIIDDLIFAQNLVATEKEIIEILHQIQSFDPPGVGARSLQECLLLQIRAKLKTNTNTNKLQLKVLRLTEFILEKYFEEFTKKHYTKLQRVLNLTEAQLKVAVNEILKLNPKPSSGYVDQLPTSLVAGHYIVPDFTIHNRDGMIELTLNSRNAPDLRINDQYLDMLRSYKDNKKAGNSNKKEKEAVLFIKQKIESAKWFIDAIKQRQDTLYKTMYAIMQYQGEYFMTGDQKKIKPMILKDIAEITSLDISTVSRVANSKFVQTEFGTKRLKDFFSESMQNEEGDEVSTLEVKKILSDLVQNESKRKPLSDEKLKNLLFRRGYNIARRTIAKYREQMNIPVARLRKELV